MRDTTYFRQFDAAEGGSARFEPLGAARIIGRVPGGVVLSAGGSLVLDVVAVAPGTFRVRLGGNGRPLDDRSFAIPTEAIAPQDVHEVGDGGVLRLETEQLAALLSLDPFRVAFEAPDGSRIAEDDADLGLGLLPLRRADGSPLVDPLGAPIRLHKRHARGTRYVGCGERTASLDRTGTSQTFWNIDPPPGHSPSHDNLYVSVPFVMALRDGRAWGLLLDSPRRLNFDLAATDPGRLCFEQDGGTLSYLVFAGPTPADVLAQLTALTGRIPLPPRWALGYHQSRWGYQDADEVRTVARDLRAHGIPCDALYLDIDHMDEFRVFTFHPRRFADPGGLVRDLADQGIRTVAIVDPGVKVDESFPVYREGRDAGLFCATFLGEEYRNVVWPGLCAFPDFTSQRARDWWGWQHAPLLDAGVDGIWCDMNEPTVFVPTPHPMPPDVVHRGDGEPRLHAEVHNAYGSLMAQATYEALRRQRPDRRPFVISRAGYAGLQRYAVHWTGDNSSWWEHLAMAMPQLQNLGLSGLPWVGVDVGGYYGDATGELLVRWTELGIFQPFCRNHSQREARRQEPWAFGEPYTSAIRDLLLLRQRLVPYLYSLFEHAHRTGAPILRPLVFEWPDDPAALAADDQLLLGPGLLVAPITRPGQEHRHVYLPRGMWRHLWSGEEVRGPAHVVANAPLGRPAVYLRASVPLPLGPPTLHDGERPLDPITILVLPSAGAAGAFRLYWDAGDGYAHEQGAFVRLPLSCRAEGSTVDVEIGAPEGDITPPWRTIEVEVRGLSTAPRAVLLDGRPLGDVEHISGRTLARLPATGEPRSLRLQLE